MILIDKILKKKFENIFRNDLKTKAAGTKRFQPPANLNPLNRSRPFRPNTSVVTFHKSKAS